MVDLASLVVRLVADTSRYSRDLDRAGNQLNGFSVTATQALKKVALIGAGTALAVGAGMVALAKSAIDAADQLNDMAKQTGISTEALSQLQYAAEQSGSDLDGLTTGLRKFVKQASDAASGGKEASKSFALIGVSVTDATGKLKPTEQLLLDVAEQFSKYKDGAAKAAFAQDLFGKSGAALIPFLNEGRAGIERLMKEADRLGLTLKGSVAQAADDFNDSLQKLNRQLGALGLQIAERALPALNDIAEAVSKLVESKKDLSGFLDGIAAGFRVIAYSAVAVADAFDDFGKLFGGLAAYVKILATQGYDAAERFQEEFNKEAIAREEATNKALERIWGQRADNYNKALGPRRLGSYLSAAQQAANSTRTGLERPLQDFPTPKQVVDPLQEVEIRLKRVEIPEDFYAEFQRNTATSLENAFKDFQTKKAQLQILRDDGELLKLAKGDAELAAQIYKDRLTAIDNEMLGVLTQGPRQAQEEIKKLNEYQLEAARNTQDIIAGTFEGLATGADISAKSILQSFGQMIVKLAAQAAAANLAGKLFGEAGGGTKGSTGWLGALAGLFGGTRDSGGRGRAGMAYMIGTGAQPEMFIPDSAGTFVPAGAGGVQVTNNFTIMSDGAVSKRTQLQVAAAAARGVERASRRNN